MERLQFSKYQGLGNDFVVVDSALVTAPYADIAKVLCDRHFGVGADGVLFVKKSDQPEMTVINSDGSQPEMCGNGLRVAAQWMVEKAWVATPEFSVLTGAGSLTISTLDSKQFTVNMGFAKLGPKEIGMAESVTTQTFISQPIGGGLKGSAVSMGNPHLVIVVNDFGGLSLEQDGPLLEKHPFFPQKTNVHFIKIDSRSEITQKTWERGAGATLACGTGACASVVAAFEQGLTDRKVTVNLPGGQLQIEYLESGEVLMTGPATKVFDGEWLMPLSS